MAVVVARDAMHLTLIAAVLGPVAFLAACAAGVFVGDAFSGDVVPVVALHASSGFFFRLYCT